MKPVVFGPAIAALLAFSTPLAAQEKPAPVTAINDVVAPGAKWETVWAGPMTADGMSTGPAGELLFAQEQSNSIWRLWPDGRAFVEVPYVLGAGAVSVDAAGHIFAVERACTDPGLNKLECSQPSRIMQLTPQRRVIADKFADGTSLGRLNDLHADGRGGAWFTQGELYHAAADGSVSLVADVSAFTNGIVTSPDGRTLYTTNRTEVLAFDIGADGKATGRRTFATLTRDTAGFGADGLEVDADGRLYVTGDAGIYVFEKSGRELGLIPVPRRAITLAFAGPDRRTLYVGAMGAVTPGGVEWTTPEGVRNVAMTVYRLEMAAVRAQVTASSGQPMVESPSVMATNTLTSFLGAIDQNDSARFGELITAQAWLTSRSADGTVVNSAMDLAALRSALQPCQIVSIFGESADLARFSARCGEKSTAQDSFAVLRSGQIQTLYLFMPPTQMVAPPAED